MFTHDYLIAHLYTDKSDKQKKALLARINPALTPEYYVRDWKEVAVRDLQKEDIQLRLIQTLYQTQYHYDGVIEEIMRTFEEWSDGTIIFEGLPVELNGFYQRWYTFAGFMFFPWLEVPRLQSLLSSPFLLRAIIHDVPVYLNIESYFARWRYAEWNKVDADLFASSISVNETELGEPMKTHKPVKEWVKLFEEYETGDHARAVDRFMSSGILVDRLDPDVKKVLHKILAIYWALRSGAMWRDLNYAIGAHDRKEVTDPKDAKAYYLQFLYEAPPEGLLEWLKDYEHVAAWLVTNEVSPEFIQDLLRVLANKVDTANPEQAILVAEFLHLLEKEGLAGVDNLFFYDESKGEFAWNPAIFADALIEDIAAGEETDIPEEPPTKRIELAS